VFVARSAGATVVRLATSVFKSRHNFKFGRPQSIFQVMV
jgi:hypothetical protein